MLFIDVSQAINMKIICDSVPLSYSKWSILYICIFQPLVSVGLVSRMQPKTDITHRFLRSSYEAQGGLTVETSVILPPLPYSILSAPSPLQCPLTSDNSSTKCCCGSSGSKWLTGNLWRWFAEAKTVCSKLQCVVVILPVHIVLEYTCTVGLQQRVLPRSISEAFGLCE